MTETGSSSPQTDCGLCLTLAADAFITDCCTKIICQQCHLKWLQKNPSCPYCRRKDDYKVHSENYLRKFIRQISPQITFIVKDIANKSYSLTMRQLDTIQMLYRRVQQRQGIPIQQLRLTANGKPLRSNHDSLKKYGIQKLSTVYCLLRLHGGDSI